MTQPRLPQRLPEPVRLFLRTELRRIPLRSWADAARTLADDPNVGIPAHSEARTRLRAAIEARPAEVARIRRTVDSLVEVAEGIVHPRDIRLMRKAALTAAFALVARDQLDPADFEDLYRPFGELIPLSVLEAEPAAAPPAAAAGQALAN